MLLRSRYLIIIMCFFASLANAARSPFELAGSTIPAGERRSFVVVLTQAQS